MAKWKKLTLRNDILREGAGELLGIEELECPDESLIISEKHWKTKTKKRKIVEKKQTAKKCKLSLQKRENKHNVEFNGFSHHNEMMSWSEFGLRDEILAALHDKKFYEPTDIQMKCLGPAVCGLRDILGAAETGSGKTLAFGIPIVNGILKMKDREPYNDSTDDEISVCSEEDWEGDENEFSCVKVKNFKRNNIKSKLLALILTPTRELAVQVKNHLYDICKYTSIKIVLVVGGLAQEKQERLLNKRPEIIVATPGRLWDLIQSRNNHLNGIHSLRFLAIDETDRMLEKGHFEELNNLLESINANEKEMKKRQNFVFSATLTLVHDPPSYLKGEKRQRITPGQKLQKLVEQIGMTNPKVVDLTNTEIIAKNIREFKVVCKFEEKDYYLHYFLKQNPGKTIIFCNSIGCVKRLANLLSILEHSPLPLHANMLQKQRLKNLEKFTDKGSSVLIATDVAARGLDISNVDQVLHYQVPKTAEIYVHRSGRTARQQKTGNVLLLIEPQEYKSYIKLIHTLGKSGEIEDLSIENDTLMYMKRIIHLARDVDQLMLALKKQNSTSNWYTKAINDMDIILDEDELPRKISDEGCRKIKTDLNKKRKELKVLLNLSHVPVNFSGKFPNREIYDKLLLEKEKEKLNKSSIIANKKKLKR